MDKLPKHSFGNLISEIGIYFENLGIKTKIIVNGSLAEIQDKATRLSLEEYSKIGTIAEGVPHESDLTAKPAIVNIDRAKLMNLQDGPRPHYVVIHKSEGQIHLFDGKSYKRRVRTTFDCVFKSTLSINRWKQNGMWLFLD